MGEKLMNIIPKLVEESQTMADAEQHQQEQDELNNAPLHREPSEEAKNAFGGNKDGDVVATAATTKTAASGYPDVFVSKGGTVKVLSTGPNLIHMMKNIMGLTFYYDVIKKELVMNGVETEKNHDKFATLVRNEIKSQAAREGLHPNIVKDYYDDATSRQMNPLTDMCKIAKWDNKDRILELIKAFKHKEEDWYVEEGIRRFLIQCVAGWDYSQHKGKHKDAKPKFEMVWVLQAPQGAKKTKTLSQLLPDGYGQFFGSGIVLNVKSKDSVKQAISYGLVELGEIGASLKKSASDDLKGFLSKPVDTMRAPYGIDLDHYQRRTSFMGTVNDEQFLVDQTGNRRFFTMRVEDIGTLDKIDMLQLWAQCWHLYTTGSKWWFDEDEKWSLHRNKTTEEVREKGVEGDFAQEIKERFDAGFPTTKVLATKLWEDYAGRIPTREERTAFSNELKKHFEPNAAGYFHLPLSGAINPEDYKNA